MVAVDLGAESCRVSLLRWLHGRPGIEPVYRFPNAPIEHAGSLYWDIEAILAALHEGLRRCASIAVEGIRSLAVDGWAVDYVRLDAGGRLLANPFCYRDARTERSQPELHKRISAERMRQLTGIQVLRINTVYQLFADDVPLQRLPWLNLPEYVLYRLGARPVSERTNASHTQLLGLDGRWSGEIACALGRNTAPPPALVAPGACIGRLTGELAALPAFADTCLIAPACHDTASAIAAIPDTGDDWAYISSGTWSLVGTVLQSPINSAEAQQENFGNLAGAGGTVCFHKNVNGMWLLRQCMEEWARAGATLALPDLIKRASRVPARDYVLDVDDPDLILPGEMPQRINAQLQRRGLVKFSAAPEHAAELASFIFRSLAARYAEVIRKVAHITGKRLRRIYIMGGGSQNEMLNRLTAEATGLEVHKAGAECSTLGNFAVQLAALEPGNQSSRQAICSWAALLGQTP